MDEITLRQMQSVTPLAPTRRDGKEAGTSVSPSGATFGELLRDQMASQPTPGGLKFSAHAQTRLQSRAIPFGPEEIKRLDAAVGRAQAKGARESLVLMDNVALVVSVKNKMVITAVDAAQLKDNVFTNIDSAVIC